MQIESNIIFIGFMGCGKSSIAREVARELNCLFIDTDNLIENSEDNSIKDIFKKHSQEYFRLCEKRVFDFLLPTKKACISPGGGFPIYINEPINKLGTVVYLEKSFQDIVSTLSDGDLAKRPLFQDIDEAKKIYESRVDIYKKQADITIKISHQSIRDVSDSVLEAISNIKTI